MRIWDDFIAQGHYFIESSKFDYRVAPYIYYPEPILEHRLYSSTNEYRRTCIFGWVYFFECIFVYSGRIIVSITKDLRLSRLISISVRGYINRYQTLINYTDSVIRDRWSCMPVKWSVVHGCCDLYLLCEWSYLVVSYLTLSCEQWEIN